MSATGYGRIERAFWMHPDHRRLPLETKGFMAYLLTGPHSNGIGAYQLPLAYVAADLGISSQTVSKLFAACFQIGFCTYCERTETVWIRGAVKYQDIRNANIAKGREREFDQIHRQCAQYPDIARDLMAHGAHWDEQFANRLETISKQVATPDPFPLPLPDPLEGSDEPSCPPTQAPTGRKRKTANRFDEWYERYPKREKRKEAREAWLKHDLDDRADELIADVARRWAEHDGWRERKYVPLPATYLNGERWTDDIVPRTSTSANRPARVLGAADRARVAMGIPLDEPPTPLPPLADGGRTIDHH